MSEKEKQRKRVFLLNNTECFALSHFNFTNQSCQSCKVGNYHNYKKRDLDNPNFSPKTKVIPIFS